MTKSVSASAPSLSPHLAASILDSLVDGFILLDRNLTVLLINRAALAMEGRQAQDILGLSHEQAWPEAYFEPLRDLYRQAIKSGEPVTLEREWPTRDGGLAWMELRILPTAEGLVLLYRDVTKRKRGIEQLELMVRELNHRVKNNLATVQSLAAQTFRGAEDLPAARAAFMARLMALSKAHDVLTRQQWEGSQLAEIAREVILPNIIDAGRLRLAGPKVSLHPPLALALSMALHELTTNAMKFGALSNERGYIDLRWSCPDPQTVEIVWQERDGPTVAPPQRQGFGVRLLQRSLAADLRGPVNLDYRPEGLVCTILAALAPSTSGS
ncbi:sensor histidine kinase [Caulobacter sp. UNC279MFTsu5.1]|uniref:sensor histidine kinase n=1 Tax=Caulobacter sp. UNC279MFTsu5.1 TaxID=1502775 RepID=UPI000674DE63|nr:HWE histidine kinase domain-containing protein [Caulobacter sp. UNC279MFTsu5.1]SFK17243.1 PAS domain S-box-containing protein [Caulobacter sp. UNC279MFTsu5.1]